MKETSGTAAVRLIVVDIEGCLIPGARRDWPLGTLDTIARYNRWARRGFAPPLTVASGRPPQYVEAVGQAVSLRLPAICENGALIYHPDDGETELLVTEEAVETIRQLEAELRKRPPLPLRIAQGKEACLSLIPSDSGEAEMAALAARMHEYVAATWDQATADAVTITFSAGAVDITPAGVDKGNALKRLMERLELAPDQVMAIGDGGNDLTMFAAVGRACAPANAHPAVKEQADRVAAASYGDGVIELVRRETETTPVEWGAEA